MNKVFALLAMLAIVISRLGSIALTAFTVGRRTGEIGIRKVPGASVNSIVLLLSREQTDHHRFYYFSAAGMVRRELVA